MCAHRLLVVRNLSKRLHVDRDLTVAWALPADADAMQGSRIVPTFSKRLRDVTDCSTAYFDLNVVPGRRRSKALIDLDRLRVPAMVLVIIAPVTEIDATDKRHVGIRGVRVANNEQLLVMAARTPYPFIQ